ncbi:hypothetical protein BCR44DRAFT_1100379 [Catenaria anguillulae PL171]|uniref:Uncharacterized protein n=1 Tax=Catenaria anguillulae PL171 TaxID=765915 RepID=A0A1Y2I1Q4_9FUNG|nr:hypothetical protein BCR44DRAFT_1100379 [Catenaria anguillulae PL171]
MYYSVNVDMKHKETHDTKRENMKRKEKRQAPNKMGQQELKTRTHTPKTHTMYTRPTVAAKTENWRKGRRGGFWGIYTR